MTSSEILVLHYHSATSLLPCSPCYCLGNVWARRHHNSYECASGTRLRLPGIIECDGPLFGEGNAAIIPWDICCAWSLERERIPICLVLAKDTLLSLLFVRRGRSTWVSARNQLIVVVWILSVYDGHRMIWRTASFVSVCYFTREYHLIDNFIDGACFSIRFNHD